MRCSINVDHIARIEGHGNIHLAIEDGAVATCEMNVVEPARLFESMVRGRTFSEIPSAASARQAMWSPIFWPSSASSASR